MAGNLSQLVHSDLGYISATSRLHLGHISAISLQAVPLKPGNVVTFVQPTHELAYGTTEGVVPSYTLEHEIRIRCELATN